MRLLLLTPMCACAFVLPAPGPRAAAPRAAAPQEVLPEPRMGDVVAFAGDWPGETSVGQIRSLQPRGERWLADVVPLEDQANNVWRLPSAARARKRRTAVDVADLVRKRREIRRGPTHCSTPVEET